MSVGLARDVLLAAVYNQATDSIMKMLAECPAIIATCGVLSEELRYDLTGDTFKLRFSKQELIGNSAIFKHIFEAVQSSPQPLVALTYNYFGYGFGHTIALIFNKQAKQVELYDSFLQGWLGKKPAVLHSLKYYAKRYWPTYQLYDVSSVRPMSQQHRTAHGLVELYEGPQALLARLRKDSPYADTSCGVWAYWHILCRALSPLTLSLGELVEQRTFEILTEWPEVEPGLLLERYAEQFTLILLSGLQLQVKEDRYGPEEWAYVDVYVDKYGEEYQQGLISDNAIKYFGRAWQQQALKRRAQRQERQRRQRQAQQPIGASAFEDAMQRRRQQRGQEQQGMDQILARMEQKMWHQEKQQAKRKNSNSIESINYWTPTAIPSIWKILPQQRKFG